MINQLALEHVHVSYNEFHINLEKPLSEQIWELNEDLLQLAIGEHYLVDVGYHPSHKLNGEFRVVAIKDYDWQQPVQYEVCKEPSLLVEILQQVIDGTKEKAGLT